MPNGLAARFNLGFSLVEMMVVVVVFGLLLAMGVPNYRIWVENTRIRNAADSIQAGIQKARVEALKYNASVRFSLVSADSEWEVGCLTPVADNDGDGREDCPTVIEHRRAKEGSANISVLSTPADGVEIVFNSLGVIQVNPAPPMTPFTQVDIDSNVLDASDSRNLRVLVSVSGSTRICDPDPGLDIADPRRCP